MRAFGMTWLVALAFATQPVQGSEFLFKKAVEFYCASMEDMNPKEMNTYERGLMEGMAFGFIMGQYPEQASIFEKMKDGEINAKFYPLIKQQCPSKSFE
jgi:hypothetical protein